MIPDVSIFGSSLVHVRAGCTWFSTVVRLWVVRPGSNFWREGRFFLLLCHRIETGSRTLHPASYLTGTKGKAATEWRRPSTSISAVVKNSRSCTYTLLQNSPWKWEDYNLPNKWRSDYLSVWHHDSAYTRWDDVTRCLLAYFAVLRKVSLHGRWRFSRSRYAVCLLSSAVELSLMVDQVSRLISDARWVNCGLSRMAANQNREIQLCLNENGNGKAVPVLSQASCHKNTSESEDIGSRRSQLGHCVWWSRFAFKL
jgi:hypothetical protein